MTGLFSSRGASDGDTIHRVSTIISISAEIYGDDAVRIFRNHISIKKFLPHVKILSSKFKGIFSFSQFPFFLLGFTASSAGTHRRYECNYSDQSGRPVGV